MVGHFPVTLCVKLKMGRLCVMVPVDKKTTVLELKEAFIAAYGDGRDPSLPSMDDDELAEGATQAQAKAQTVDSIKLFKHTLDEDDNDAWIPMDDHKSSVDKVGLDQGHVVGVSLKTNGTFADPMIANPEDEPASMPME